MVVARRGHADAHEILIVVDGLDHRAEEEQEQGVLRRGLAGLEKVDARVGDDGPVVVLAGAVDAREGLLVQQAYHAVLSRDALHELHRELVVVGGDVGGGIDGRQLMLGGGGLIMLGLRHDAELPQLLVQILHVFAHSGLDGAEVVVVQLLSLGGLCAEEGAPGVLEILAPLVYALVDEKILLLGPDSGLDEAHVLVAKELDDTQALAADGLHRAQQRRLFIQRLAPVGAEGRRDAQHPVLDEGVGGGVPGGVAPGLEGGAQAAGGEGAGVRFALDELLAGKFHNDPAAAHGGDEAVVLLGGDAGHGLEPVGEVRRALFDGPVLHGVGHHRGGGGVETAPLVHGALNLSEHFLGQALPHDGVVENHAAEKFRDCTHKDSPQSASNKICRARKRDADGSL